MNKSVNHTITKPSPKTESSAVKKIISKLLPRSVKDFLLKYRAKYRCWRNLILNFRYDIKRFNKWSVAQKPGGILAKSERLKTRANLEALMTMEYHRIEKGLSFKEPRVAFGAEIVASLIERIRVYQDRYNASDDIVHISINTLMAYYQYNLEHGRQNQQLYNTILNLQNRCNSKPGAACNNGGIKTVTRDQIWKDSKKDLKAFFWARHSVRQYETREVDMDLIVQAVEMAQRSPSVCNRQSSKVYVFSDPQEKEAVLDLQLGNRGFGDQASKVLIVTSDLQNFVSIGERNQGWIDGGMYAMSLVYALHSLGLGTCCLNWSKEYQLDQQLRQVAGIGESEVIIMMIAVGHLPDEFMVAQSPRKDLSEILIVK